MNRLAPLLALLAILAAVGGVWISSNARAESQALAIANLQDENRQLHSLLNESETKRAELVAQVDWIDRAAFWTGYYQSCVDVARLQEPTCYSLMQTMRREAEGQ